MKYESDGGPGIKRIMDILPGSSQALQDKRTFLKTQILFWLLGAVDGHAKNFSIFLEREGRFRMTPCYDVLSIYPAVGKGKAALPIEKVRMAMAVKGEKRHYKRKQVFGRHWISTASFRGFPIEEMVDVIDEILSRIPEAITKAESVIPGNFPEFAAESIFRNERLASKRLTL